MSASAGPNIVKDGLVLCLDAGNRDSYPGTGTTWYDISGNNNHGTLTNGPVYNSSNGGIITFDGINDYINLIRAVNVSTSTGFTFSIFLKQNSTQANSNWNYFYSRTSPSIEIGTYGTSPTRFEFKDNSGTGTSVLSSNVVNFWSYIAFGTSATTRIPFMYTYNESNYQLSTSTLFSNTTIGFERFFITGTSGSPQIGGPYYYGAKCIMIAIYNRTLTALEVQQNYYSLRGRFGL